jgi:hypothetical protein
VLAIATPIAIIATLVVNTLSNFVPPGGQNIGQLANSLLSGVQILPANYAFAIWGLIYLGLIAYGIYQYRPALEGDRTIQRVDTLLIIACVAQIIWVLLFTLQQFWWSVLFMLAILLPLIGIYLQLDIGRGRSDRRRKWSVDIPFSVYLGWISIATIVNVASALYISGWGGDGSATGWTVAMLVVGIVLGAIVVLQRADIAFTLVFIWAFVAIAVRQSPNTAILITALVGAAILAVLLFIATRRGKVLRGNGSDRTVGEGDPFV